jgi:hypothetical protein
MFPLISSITQQPTSRVILASRLTSSLPAANKIVPSKNLTAYFSESFISSGKQLGRAPVLWEGHDIVIRETCLLLL